MIILPILFFITAILYSSVGFGGGSTYLALLLIWDIPYFIFPIIALLCNIIVVSGNSFNYIRAGNHNFKLIIPFLIPFPTSQHAPDDWILNDKCLLVRQKTDAND